MPMRTLLCVSTCPQVLAETAAEAEALSRLRHENMMRFYGICFLKEQRSVAMVLELCQMDLRDWIDASGPFGIGIDIGIGIGTSIDVCIYSKNRQQKCS